MINRKGEKNLFSTCVFTNPSNGELLCLQENVPLLSHFVLCKIDWIFLQIRLVFKSECVSGPSSFAQVVQVGCRQHPSFLSLASWGNKVAPPFPLSFARLLSVNSFSLHLCGLENDRSELLPKGERKRERERNRGKEWRNPALTDLAQGVAGRYIACRVQRIIATLISPHGLQCYYTHKHVPYLTLRQWG